MDRSQLEQKAFDIARADMQNLDASDEDIWKEVRKCSDTTLIVYVAESGDEEND